MHRIKPHWLRPLIYYFGMIQYEVIRYLLWFIKYSWGCLFNSWIIVCRIKLTWLVCMSKRHLRLCIGARVQTALGEKCRLPTAERQGKKNSNMMRISPGCIIQSQIFSCISFLRRKQILQTTRLFSISPFARKMERRFAFDWLIKC